VAQGLSEVLAALSTREFEGVFAPFGRNFIGFLNVFDKVGGISCTPFEGRFGHGAGGRQLAWFVVMVYLFLGWCNLV
jgi:hypothetical protein